jgi:hypothetical protein
VGEHKLKDRRRTTAVREDGTDAFIAIAERLEATKSVVAALLPHMDKLPAGTNFAAFSLALQHASTLYELYLETDAMMAEAKHMAAANELNDAPRIVTAH